MNSSDTGPRLTRQELAWELVEVFDELSVERVNELLAKNVPLETLEFFTNYAKDFGEANREKLGLFAESLVKKVLNGPITFL